MKSRKKIIGAEFLVGCCFVDKAGLIDLDQEDLMILLPPLFTLKDAPVNLA